MLTRDLVVTFSHVSMFAYVSKIDLDLHNFIYSTSCLHLPLFRSQTAIVFKKSIVFTFSHVKAYVSKIDLAEKKSQGHPMVIVL